MEETKAIREHLERFEGYGIIEDGERWQRASDALDALEARLKAAEELAERRRQDRADALSVTTTDGLSASEWVARAGKAERERDEWKARAEQLERLRSADHNALASVLNWASMQRKGLPAPSGTAKAVIEHIRQLRERRDAAWNEALEAAASRIESSARRRDDFDLAHGVRSLKR